MKTKLDMSKISLSSYELIAQVRGQEVIYYHMFGEYQGEWVLISKDDENYFVYKGSYGSCSGCDHLQDVDPTTKGQLLDFAKEYNAFLVVPVATMRNVVTEDKLLEILPANIRDEFSEINIPSVATDSTIMIKLVENIDITVGNILECKNQEIKQKAIKKYGYEKFVSDAGFDSIDEWDGNCLLSKDDLRFLKLKDSSTDREYLLRVPPGTNGVKEGIAWTFDMKETEYNPLVQT